MIKINRIKLQNYRQFEKYEIIPNDKINILIGDNEVGKSTILEAIELTTSGNIKKIESIGLSNLINQKTIKDFINSTNKSIEKFPKMIVELYLDGLPEDWRWNGKNNTLKQECSGIKFICELDEDYYDEINHVFESENKYFPYEFYKIKFQTFANQPYSSFNKDKIKSGLINNLLIDTKYSINEFVKKMYYEFTNDISERIKNNYEFNNMKEQFYSKKFNYKISTNYHFGLKHDSSNDFENELMIYKDNVSLNNCGASQQIMIKTNFAVEKVGDNFNNILLFDEPENHLSSINLRSLLDKLINATNKQLFITTHNSYSCMRMETKNALLLHKDHSSQPIGFNNLNDETSKYFIKMPPAGLLDLF